jgi:hypothetical protein
MWLCNTKSSSSNQVLIVHRPSTRVCHVAAPDHHALTVAPDLANATFTGDESIDLHLLEPTPISLVTPAVLR